MNIGQMYDNFCTLAQLNISVCQYICFRTAKKLLISMFKKMFPRQYGM